MSFIKNSLKCKDTHLEDNFKFTFEASNLVKGETNKKENVPKQDILDPLLAICEIAQNTKK
jgi:hypothetical protein